MTDLAQAAGPDVVPAPPVVQRTRRLPREFRPHFGSIPLHVSPLLGALDASVGVLLALVLGWDLRSSCIVVGATLGTCAWLRLYRRRLSLLVLNDAPYLLVAVLVGQLLSLVIDESLEPDRLVPHLRQGVALFAVLLLTRTMAFRAVGQLRRSGRACDLGLIVGACHVGIELARNLCAHPEYGVKPIGFIDSNPRVASPEELPAPVIGDYSELAEVIEDFTVSHVIVAFGAAKEMDLVDMLRTCDRLHCQISFVPRLFELHQTTRDMDDVWGTPLIRVRRAAFRSFSWRLKRVFDVLVSGVLLLLLSPLLAACALAVRLEGGPGVLFRQNRVGMDGRPFEILKFRSMRPVDESESQSLWNISQDDRVGRVGRLLRATSLDELPQLWNVLNGGMSLVGPRPERPHFVEEFSNYIPRYMARHRVPAGLTGWAQIHGLRGDTSIRDRASFDNFYIENWSLWGDVKILLRTVSQVLKRAGG